MGLIGHRYSYATKELFVVRYKVLGVMQDS